jgi:hypothetical protein
MQKMEREGQQDDGNRLDRFIIQTLAVLGGLAGLLITALQLSSSMTGLSSSHIPNGWSEVGLAASAAFLLLSLAGISGGVLYTRNKSRAGQLLLICGLLGFPIGYMAWIASVGLGLLGWIMWIPPGVLLTSAGLLAWITPERLRSILGQSGETSDMEPVDRAIFVGAVLAGIGLLTVILIIGGFLLYGAEEFFKGDAGRDQDDFSSANIAISMGRWDKAEESYDNILSRNQSNLQAWKDKGYALEKQGKYSEASKAYAKAKELEDTG